MNNLRPPQQQDASPDDERAEFLREIEAEAERSVEVDVSGFFRPGGAPLPKLRVKINTKAQDIAALRCAHEAAAKATNGLSDLARDSLIADPDLLDDLKNVEALHRAFRDPKHPDRLVFPTPEWMLENFDTDRLAVLGTIYREVVKRLGPMPYTITHAFCEGIRDAVCAGVEAGVPVPELPMAGLDREYVTQFLVEALQCWKACEDKLSEVSRELAALKSERDES